MLVLPLTIYSAELPELEAFNIDGPYYFFNLHDHDTDHHIYSLNNTKPFADNSPKLARKNTNGLFVKSYMILAMENIYKKERVKIQSNY